MPGLSIASSASPVAAQAAAGHPAATGVGGALFAALLKAGVIGHGSAQAGSLFQLPSGASQSAHPLNLVNGHARWLTPDTDTLLLQGQGVVDVTTAAGQEPQAEGQANDSLTAAGTNLLAQVVGTAQESGDLSNLSADAIVAASEAGAADAKNTDQLNDSLQRGASVSAAAHGTSHDEPGAVAAAVLVLTPAAGHTAVLNGAPGGQQSAEAKQAVSETAAALATSVEDAALPDASAIADKSSGQAGNQNDGTSKNSAAATPHGKAHLGPSAAPGGEAQSAPLSTDTQSAPARDRSTDRFIDFLQPAGRDATHPAAAVQRSLDGLVFDMTGGARSASASNVIVAPATHLAAAIGLKIARAVENGDTRFTIRIDPPELGRVDVRLDLSADSRVKAHLVADTRETLQVLQRDSHALQRALQDSGLKADSGSLSFTLRDDGDQAGKQIALGQSDSNAEDLSLIQLDEGQIDAPLPVVRSNRLVDLSV